MVSASQAWLQYCKRCRPCTPLISTFDIEWHSFTHTRRQEKRSAHSTFWWKLTDAKVPAGLGHSVGGSNMLRTISGRRPDAHIVPFKSPTMAHQSRTVAMEIKQIIPVVALLAAAVWFAIQQADTAHAQSTSQPNLVSMKRDYRRPPPRPIENQALVDLGRDLFFEPRISASEEQVTTKIDRKSTRLNSSHQIISYAVFCLKKKTNQIASYKY